jgi:long-chain acyl-CoA synthetase
LTAGDNIALLCSNRPEFIVAYFASHRSGLRLTPVNWNLAEDEIAYIVEDSGAKALIADAKVADAAANAVRNNQQLQCKLAIGGAIEGFDAFEAALEARDASDIDNPRRGDTMLYTSGTTGKPKGVKRPGDSAETAAFYQEMVTDVFGFKPLEGSDCSMVSGPLYHTGPLNLCVVTPLTSGIGVVVMPKWNAELTLRVIEHFRISHTFCVPTMFNRLLALPDSVRLAHDVSSMRFIIHGAAPVSVPIKKAMIDWMGPILTELIASTEGQGLMIGSEEWLRKPGTVGRPADGQVRIVDEAGQEVARGESGRIYWRMLSPFEYHNAPEKTAEAQDGDYFTAGDIGYQDEDGYLFLSGRSAEIINSGGVNIYPVEIDDVLLEHEAVADVACIGVPHDDMGEVVKAVVELKPGLAADDELAADIVAFCDGRLAVQKWPRSVDFIDEIPRSDAGKILRKGLRDRYWADHSKKI